MKQPDLGKKISELRLAKGLTQSELAEKCNLSLRTIQRIESAEVTPRSYSVKLILKIWIMKFIIHPMKIPMKLIPKLVTLKQTQKGRF
jgi:transcriptional regulator with XRE-family HTH domain